MAVTPIRRFGARSAGPTLFGPQASNSISPKNDSSTARSAANPVAPKSATKGTASAEILRARDLLRDVLLRDDETDGEAENAALVGEVSSRLNEIVCALDNLAGLQHLFEVWSS